MRHSQSGSIVTHTSRLAGVLILAFSSHVSAVDLPICSNFNADTPGFPPATGGPNQPSSLNTPKGTSIIVVSSAHGMNRQPILLDDGGTQERVRANYSFDRLEAGILRVETTIAASDSGFVGILRMHADGSTTTVMDLSQDGSIHAWDTGAGGPAVGRYDRYRPFRVRADIDLDEQTWDVTIDEEMNGFFDNVTHRGLHFSNSVPNDPPHFAIETVSLELWDWAESDNIDLTYDDVVIRLLPPNGQVTLEEGFEESQTIFDYSATGGVPYDVSNTEAAHSGDASFKVGRSSCSASCFDNYRVDLQHIFDETVFVESVELWALEHSTSGTGWGGKIRVGHDTTWNLNWWGVIENGDPITGEWQHRDVPVQEMATDIRIQVFDVTSRSTIWLDDIVIRYRGESNPAEIQSLTVIVGDVISGSVAEVTSSDDEYFQTRSGFGNNLADLHQMELLVSATAMSGGAVLSATLEAHINEPAGTSEVLLRNWNTGGMDLIKRFPIQNSDTRVTFEGLCAFDYVDPSNRLVEMSVKHRVFAPFLAFAFDSFIDLIEISVQ